MAKDSSMPTTRTTRAKTKGTRSLLDEKLLRIVCDRLPWNAPLKDRANVWKSVDVALWQGELPQFNARSRFAELSDTYYHGAARTKVSPAVYTLLDSIATGNIVSCGDAQALAGKTRKSAAEVRDTEVKRQKLSKRGQKKDAPREEVVKAIKRKKDPEEEEEEEEVVEILVDEEETQEEGKCATDGEVKKDKLEPSRAVSSATDITREESGAVVSSALVPIATRPTFEVISQYLEGNRKERASAYETVDNLIAAQERDQTLAKKYLKFLE